MATIDKLPKPRLYAFEHRPRLGILHEPKQRHIKTVYIILSNFAPEPLDTESVNVRDVETGFRPNFNFKHLSRDIRPPRLE